MLWVTLCALIACTGTLRPRAESIPAAARPADVCRLSEAPSHYADTATLAFSVLGGRREACALRLVAAALRPWPTLADHGRWTVQITLTDAGAAVRRIDTEHARDAIDAGFALFATEDLDLIAYTAARPDLDVSPLPWDRTYLRLTPDAKQPLGAEGASDAVRVDARPAEPLACDTGPITPTSRDTEASSARVVYDAGDPTARELAERIVALANGRTVAAGLDRVELDASLRAGDELAYIVSVPRSGNDGCDALALLSRRAPWLTRDSITPLVDTRAHAILPRSSQP